MFVLLCIREEVRIKEETNEQKGTTLEKDGSSSFLSTGKVSLSSFTSTYLML